MTNKKNKFMLWITLGTVLLSIVTHMIGRSTELFVHTGMIPMHEAEVMSGYLIGLNALLIIPIALWLVAYVISMISQNEHPHIPLYLTLALTFCSISIIAGSGGGIEFHFSIFMVVAIAAYYERISLVLVMTVLFAVQHFAGFYLFHELVFGFTPTTFTMLLIHALYLIMTAGATILQINSKTKIAAALEAEKQLKDEQLTTVLSGAQSLSADLDQSSIIVTEKSAGMVLMNEQMNLSFKEVSVGLESQSESIQQIEHNLHTINDRIIETSESSDAIRKRAADTGDYVDVSHQHISELFDQILILSSSIQAVQETITQLNDSSLQIEDIISTVQEVADQTGMLALNAAIEAARAGESGRGFSVVASEIRKLADRSKASTAEIQTILLTIKSESEASAVQIATGKQAVDSSVQKAEDTIQGFTRMRQDIQQMVQQIAQLNDAILEIKTGSARIASEIGNISSITEENVAAVEELTASSEEQVNAYNSVDHEVRQLQRLSRSLSDSFVTEQS